MRVIAGSARRAKLFTLEGNSTRPTSDQIKETLFNILAGELEDVVFLDLFAGSGGIGIEALSRGAREAVFVEKNPKAVEVIKKNLSVTRFTEQALVCCEDFNLALLRLEKLRTIPWDIIFLDPPYDKGFEIFALDFFKNSRLVDEHTLIIVEASLKTEWGESPDWEILRVKEYKSNKHIFIRRREKYENCGLSGKL